jgi:hypothetical protein
VAVVGGHEPGTKSGRTFSVVARCPVPRRHTWSVAPRQQKPVLETWLSELVEVLRDRLKPSTVKRSIHLLDELTTSGLVGEDDPAGSTISRITEVVQGAEGYVGTALRLMTGLDLATSDPLMTRTDILEEMARVLGEGRRGVMYSPRWAETQERLLLAPVVAVGLGLLEHLPEDVRDVLPQGVIVSAESSWRAPDRDARELPVFVQYCNPEMFRLSHLDQLLADRAAMFRLLRSATRIALLVTDSLVLFPASYIFEVPGFQDFLAEAGPARDLGLLGYVSPTPDLREFAEMKAPEYRHDEQNPYEATSEAIASAAQGLIWRPRSGHATAAAIGRDWRDSLEGERGSLTALAGTVSHRTGTNQSRVLSALAKVPDRLDGSAFVGRFAREVLDIDLSRSEAVSLDVFLSNSYLKSYISDLDAIILVDFTFADLSLGLSATRAGRYRLVHIRPLELGLARLNVDKYLLERATWDEFLAVRSLPMLSLAMDALLHRSGSWRTGAALARLRHPSRQPTSVEDVFRLLDDFSKLLAHDSKS